MARLFFHLSIVLDRSNNANCYIFCGFFSLKKLTRMLLLAVIFFLWPIKYATPIMSIWGSLPGQYPMFMKRCKKGQIDYSQVFCNSDTIDTHLKVSIKKVSVESIKFSLSNFWMALLYDYLVKVFKRMRFFHLEIQNVQFRKQPSFIIEL